MTLRARLVMLTSAAVALAIVAASVAAWLLIRSMLLDQVDERLLERAPDGERVAALAGDSPGEAPTGAYLGLLQGDSPIGLQVVGADGEVERQLTPDAGFDLVAAGEQLDGIDPGDLPDLRTVTLNGESFRVLSVDGGGDGGYLRMFQSLGGVETTMGRIAWLLVAVAAVGVALAGGVGWLTTRAGLRPIGGLVEAAARVATTRDLGHRIAVTGSERDDVSRLTHSLNAMLAALDGARAQQRELVDNVGHELRTPLAALRNDLGLLLRSERGGDRALSPGERAELLGALDAEVAALSDLVAEVLDLARGDLEPEAPVDSDVAAIVERAVARARRIAPDLEVRIDGSEHTATVRAVAFERAVANLVRNALQVSPAGPAGDDWGVVEVSLAIDGDEVVVRVADRGPGIAAEDLPRVFDRFYRGAAARERHGSGLGLAIVAQAAELHGGTVEAANRLGGGAEFTLRVPANGGAEAAT